MSAPTDQQKKSLRTLMQYSRTLRTARSRRVSANDIIRALLSCRIYQEARVVCLYMSRFDEVDTKPLLADLLSRSVTVLLPRVENNTVTLRVVRSVWDFTRGSYDILEPKKSCPVAPAQSVDLFIVPGLAFDKKGYRLGRGKGYYDRLLTGVSAAKIGLAYETQMVAKVPRASYDVPMTAVVTEDRIYENKTS